MAIYSIMMGVLVLNSLSGTSLRSVSGSRVFVQDVRLTAKDLIACFTSFAHFTWVRRVYTGVPNDLELDDARIISRIEAVVDPRPTNDILLYLWREARRPTEEGVPIAVLARLLKSSSDSVVLMCLDVVRSRNLVKDLEDELITMLRSRETLAMWSHLIDPAFPYVRNVLEHRGSDMLKEEEDRWNAAIVFETLKTLATLGTEARTHVELIASLYPYRKPIPRTIDLCIDDIRARRGSVHPHLVPCVEPPGRMPRMSLFEVSRLSPTVSRYVLAYPHNLIRVVDLYVEVDTRNTGIPVVVGVDYSSQDAPGGPLIRRNVVSATWSVVDTVKSDEFRGVISLMYDKGELGRGAEFVFSLPRR